MRPFIIILSSAMLFFSCNENKKHPEVKAAEDSVNIITLNDTQIKNAAIGIGKMEQKKISSILKLNGKIDVPPQNMVSISAPLGGYLKSTKLLPGMHVKKGEVIAVLEDQQYIQLQQDYLTAKAKINALENEYQRQKELNRSQASSDKAYQQSEADYRSQRVLITALGQKMQLAGIELAKVTETNISKSVNIYAPITGYVSAVNVNIGRYITPVDVLFELINPSDIHLALKVFEKDINKLFIGQQLEAYTNNLPEKKHPCKIILIGKDLSADRNTEVHCHFEDYDKSLLPGTYMNAEIQVNSGNCYVLPNDAIVRFEGREYVFKAISKYKFEMCEVKTGEIQEGFTEIILTDKNTNVDFPIVTKGAYSLLMAMKNKEE